jgi:hypothetical protein
MTIYLNNNMSVYNRFQLKTFRKTTRFKKYNLGFTLFTRKLLVSKKKRLG